ncbi:cobalamin biosynthesis protein [Nocardia jiangsuensis]|uniref:Cobalamin biosynthesis protein n=1 Tax=Nocardia jiangsuensis TaxID=1691563 RepID=A0ABV8DQL1_9NOCA
MPDPRSPLTVGIGLRPGTPGGTILAAIRSVLGDHAIARIATLDTRAAEPGPRAAAERLGVPLLACTAAELATVPVPNPGRYPSVAEAAALLAGSGPLVVPKTPYAGTVTVAAAH